MDRTEWQLIEMGQRAVLDLLAENEGILGGGRGSPAAFAEVSGRAWEAQFGWRHQVKGSRP